MPVSAIPLTQERLKELLHYDPETGVFTWVGTRAHRIKNGDVAGTIAKRGRSTYLQISLGGRRPYGHQLAWLYVHGEWVSEVDHRDGDGLNNCIRNLRPCTSTQNKANRRAPTTNTSGYKGVVRGRHGKWRAVVACRGKQYHCGFFIDPAEAHEAYKRKAAELFGEFAKAS